MSKSERTSRIPGKGCAKEGAISASRSGHSQHRRQTVKMIPDAMAPAVRVVFMHVVAGIKHVAITRHSSHVVCPICGGIGDDRRTRLPLRIDPQ